MSAATVLGRLSGAGFLGSGLTDALLVLDNHADAPGPTKWARR